MKQLIIAVLATLAGDMTVVELVLPYRPATPVALGGAYLILLSLAIGLALVRDVRKDG
jgi:hypothetical protein